MANEYFVAAINRVGVEEYGDNDFYGTSYFVDPRGQFVGDVASGNLSLIHISEPTRQEAIS